MTSLAEEITLVLAPFAQLFGKPPIWERAQILLLGLLLGRGNRTVSRGLQVMGLADERHFINYHRVLSRAKWSGLKATKILLDLIVALLPSENVIIIGIDDTLERRWGKRIPGLGMHRDAVRSSQQKTILCSGLRWQVMQVLVPVPWSSRVWALPFFSVLMPPQDRSKLPSAHKTSLDWASQMVWQVSRRLKRSWICVGDGSFGNAKLGWACRRCGATLVSRLPQKARLYEFAPLKDPHRPGRPRTKGARLPVLEQLIATARPGDKPRHSLSWYGGLTVQRQLMSGTAVWDVEGYLPLPLRWVIVIDPTGKAAPSAFFSTNLSLSPQDIVEIFVQRWSVEVTFEELRAHLGFQTQRHWSKPAVQRTTPVIFASFSLCCLFVYRSDIGSKLRPRSTAWYDKRSLTFADILEAIRLEIWHFRVFRGSAFLPALALLPTPGREQLISLLASSL
jgi:DDE superfamily endonuclease/Archaeal putative transposase ISC1217